MNLLNFVRLFFPLQFSSLLLISGVLPHCETKHYFSCILMTTLFMYFTAFPNAAVKEGLALFPHSILVFDVSLPYYWNLFLYSYLNMTPAPNPPKFAFFFHKAVHFDFPLTF